MSHQSQRPQIFAHRGARRVAPENTLPAFAAALEMGADGIELRCKQLYHDREEVTLFARAIS